MTTGGWVPRGPGVRRVSEIRQKAAEPYLAGYCTVLYCIVPFVRVPAYHVSPLLSSMIIIIIMMMMMMMMTSE
jgi:hypothetical protein